MAKAKKDKVVYQENYREGGVTLDMADVLSNAKKGKAFHVINTGKMESGTEFITIKIFV